MYDLKQLPRTPAWARRLKEVSTVTALEMSADLLALAGEDLVDHAELDAAGIHLDPLSLAATQYAVDWQGRCIIMDTNAIDSQKVALATMWCAPQQSTVILTQPKDYARWARAIRSLWPDHSISVYGNSRYSKQDDGVGYPEGVTYGDNPDVHARWQITSYGSFVYHDVMSRQIPDQLIVDELTDKRSVNYRWMEALVGLFLETPRVLMLQNVNAFATDSTDSLTSILTPNSDGHSHLMWLMHNAVMPGNRTVEWLSGMESGNTIQHLHTHGYPKVDLLQMISLMGVSTHLMAVDPHQSLRFHDNGVSKAIASGYANASMRKYVDLANGVCTRAGASLDELAARLLDDPASVDSYFNELKNSTWANLKSALLAKVHGQLTSRKVNIAILAENENLLRALRMRVNEELFGDKQNTDLTTARYLHPRDNWRHYWSGEIPPPINTLIFRNVGDLSVDILAATDYLVLAEWPHDAQMMNMLIDLAHASQTRIVHTTLNGTFERSIEDVLLPASV